MTPSIVSVSKLQVTFDDRVVIDDLSFELGAGEALAIIGPNGAGKTVLLKALLGLIPYGGEIGWSPDARLGYVPQKVAADWQLPLRVSDLLEAKLRTLKVSVSELRSVCSEVDLPVEVLNSSIGSLSGGQFQKSLIAFALLGRPNVLLFDEPTASLDELSEERIYELLHGLQLERRMTVLLVSHDLSVVYRYATKVLCMSRAVSCMGPPQEVLTPANLEKLYGAPPLYYQHIHEHGRSAEGSAEPAR